MKGSRLGPQDLFIREYDQHDCWWLLLRCYLAGSPSANMSWTSWCNGVNKWSGITQHRIQEIQHWNGVSKRSFPWLHHFAKVIWVIDMSDPFQFHYVWAPKVFVPWMVWCLSDLASSCTASIGQGDVIILVGPLWEFLGVAKFHARVCCPWLVDVHMQPWTLSSRMERVISWFDVAYGSTLQIHWKHITLPETNITPETLLEDEFPAVKIGFLAVLDKF